jgi:phosphatidate phosphatase PAH1
MADPQGYGAPQAPQGTAAPEAAQQTSAVSLDDVNRAITARFRDFDKKIETRLGEQFSSFETKLTEMLAAKPAEAEGKPAADAKAQSVDEHPAVKSLQKQLAEIKNKNAEIERLRAEEAQKGRDLAMRGKLTEALASHGIEGTRAKGALALLVDSDKRVSVDADGTIVFRDGNGDALDLQTGLKSWAASEDAKLYLPPRGAAGSGDTGRTTNTGAPRNAQDPKTALDQLIAQRFFR